MAPTLDYAQVRWAQSKREGRACLLTSSCRICCLTAVSIQMEGFPVLGAGTGAPVTHTHPLVSRNEDSYNKKSYLKCQLEQYDSSNNS